MRSPSVSFLAVLIEKEKKRKREGTNGGEGGDDGLTAGAAELATDDGTATVAAVLDGGGTGQGITGSCS